ncbi:MAG TPA: nitroreductase family protein [Candidatus Lokiarchaeia archaeon]|nr:nitroreductase family protein [Candidatus Lokiarchaeia archaeon]
MNETIDNILKRRSCRDFNLDPVDDGDLDAILQCGTYAPSGMNEQPYHFTVFQNPGIREQFSAIVKQLFLNSPLPRARQRAEADDFDPFYHAHTAIIVSGDVNSRFPKEGCSAAMENMMVAAESLGLGTCFMGFLEGLKQTEEGLQAIQLLGVPEGFDPLYVMALGYKKNDDIEAPPRREDLVNYLR